MTELPDDADVPCEPTVCEHYWASHHEPGHRLYWVRQCMTCHAVDWDDLDHEIDALTAAAAEQRAAEALWQSGAITAQATTTEQERIRQLAIERKAVYVVWHKDIKRYRQYPFADLLGDTADGGNGGTP